MKITDIVECCLRKIPETRESDTKLMYAVYRQMGMKSDDTVASFFKDVLDGKYPPLATITRAKRKIVEQHPELDCSAQVREKRNELEEQYKAFARG